MIPEPKDYYSLQKPMSVSAPSNKPTDSLPRIYPRQTGTGYTRGVQTIGFGIDALDGPNNRIVLSGNSIFVDPMDTTKIAQFDMSGITTATTQTLTVPDNSGTLQLEPTGYTTFAPAATGYSVTPTTTVARYLQQGKLVFMDISITGTSNATTLTFTLPVAPKSPASYQLIVTDNSTAQNDPGLVTFTAASTTATCYKNLDVTAFTNSGTKAIRGFGIVFEAN